MKRISVWLLIVVATLFGPQISAATVLSFDDLGADGFVPADYGGLDWSASDWFAFSGAQDPYTPHSGAFRVVSGFGDPDAATAIGFVTPSVFQGAWFSGLAGATVTFLLYDAGVLVATSATLDPSTTPAFLASGYDGLIDRIVVASPAQGSFALDDLRFAASAVPEPESLALMLAGLCALGVGWRRGAVGRGRA